MAKRIYIGNLKWSINDEELRSIFSEAGTVISANVILDRTTGRSRGFGFVEMSSDGECQRAIQLLNGKNIDGRPLIVKEALPEGNREDNNGDRLAMGLAIQIGAFCKGAVEGDNYRFKIGENHFTIVRD